MLIRTPPAQLLQRRPDWTAAIKEVMGSLGKSLGFNVSAAGYPGGEFLYDMVWYELNNDGFLLTQRMVMECEWRIAPPNVVDDDFQKLVQARADVRIWVSNAANPTDFQRHFANCKKQIELFEGSREGDQYVFLFLEWLNRSDHFLKMYRI